MKVEPDAVDIVRNLSGAEAWAIMTGVRSCPVDAPPSGVPFLVMAEGVKICIAQIADDRAAEVLAVACPHSSHGAHPKVAGRFAALRRSVEDQGLDDFIKFGERNEGACPLCAGARWFSIDSGQARGVVVLASLFGVFRGVGIPRGGGATALTDVDGLVMMRSLFAGVVPESGNTPRKALDASAIPVPPDGAGASFITVKEKKRKEKAR